LGTSFGVGYKVKKAYVCLCVKLRTDKGMACSRGIFSEPDCYRSIDSVKKWPDTKKLAAKSLLKTEQEVANWKFYQIEINFASAAILAYQKTASFLGKE
jgi:hypothetical protein